MRLRTTAGRLGRAAWENSYFDGGLVTLRVNGQFGPRQMWDEAEAAHRWWIEHGSRTDGDSPSHPKVSEST